MAEGRYYVPLLTAIFIIERILNMSLLEITNLSHTFGDNPLYKNAELTLNKGEHIGIVGQNGAGKSTLIKICTEQVIPDKGHIAWQSNIAVGYLDQYAEIEKQIAKGQAKINRKVAYLTFDDGPSLIVTPRILDILDEYDIKATFFVVGKMAERHPEMLQRIYEKGHSIGNHSYSHNYGYLYKNSSNFLNDIEKSNKVFKKILGDDFNSNLVRFPGGSFGKNNKIIQAVVDAGYKYYDWNSLNGDAEGKKFSKDRLVKRFKETSRNKKKLIVLMHDTDAKDTTPDSLKEIIEYLINQGYEFDVLENYNE
jgi:peptidoglycan/xylan/chitin deacetylase (PgdA/CDA1 family)